ncbi:MAG TPA: hypothetical protein VGE07_27120 [Herpetosiphonaceae bacterium]
MPAFLRRIILFALLAAIAAPAASAGSAAMPVPEDRFWDDQFIPPGVSWNEASSFVNEVDIGPEGQLYAAGRFRQAGGATANSVARWDGRDWRPLGGGITRLSGSPGLVNDLVWWRGELYAGGVFDAAGGVAAYCLARWNGSRWAPVGDGSIAEAPNGGVTALEVYNDELYVAGYFSRAGNLAASRIVRWDGNRWASLGPGVGGPSGTGAEALAIHNNSLYVGGVFTQTGTLAAHNIARWDGGQWSAAGNAASQTGERIETLLSTGGNLYAGGQFSGLGGSDAKAVARWDGTRWNAVGPADAEAPSRASALTLRQGVLYAGSAGGAMIRTWDGGRWRQAAAGGQIRDFAQTAQALYVGGSFEIARRTSHPLADFIYGGAAQLQDGAFVALGNAPPEAEADSQRSLVATDGAAYLVTSRNVLVWDRLRWQAIALPSGSTGYSFYPCVTAIGADLYVVVQGSAPPYDTRVMRRRAGVWQDIGLAEGGIGPLLAMNGILYAGGSFTKIGGVAAGGLAAWDGSQWRAVASSLSNGANPGIIHALAASNNQLIVGGRFTEINGVATRHLARWNGAEWSSIAAPAGNSETERIAVAGDQLFIFDTSTGIQRWDGQAWSVLALLRPNAMTAHRGQLVVGGRFSTISGVAANNIARWDGAAWQPVGSGLNSEVQGLGVSGNDLFVAGLFTEAGGKRSLSFARWNDQRTPIFIPTVLR